MIVEGLAFSRERSRGDLEGSRGCWQMSVVHGPESPHQRMKSESAKPSSPALAPIPTPAPVTRMMSGGARKKPRRCQGKFPKLRPAERLRCRRSPARAADNDGTCRCTSRNSKSWNRTNSLALPLVPVTLVEPLKLVALVVASEGHSGTAALTLLVFWSWSGFSEQ